MAGKLLLFSPPLPPSLSLRCSSLLSMLCGRKIIHAAMDHYPSSGPPWPSHMPTDSLLQAQALILHYTARPSRGSRISLPTRGFTLPTQNLTDRTRIYTRIQACAHSFPPVLSLRCSSPFPSLSHPSSAARSRPFSLPSSAFLLLDCITSSRTLPRPLYLCTLPSPAPSPMAGNGSCSGAMPPPDSRRLRQQPALRAVVLLPSRH